MMKSLHLLKAALEEYREALKDESADELMEEIKSTCHYVIEPELTYTCFADAARNNSFNREYLQKAFNNIEQSDPLFTDLLQILICILIVRNWRSKAKRYDF